MGVSYNKNAGLAVDADLTLFVVDVDVSVKTQNCSDTRLKWDAEWLRPTFEVRCEVDQTC